MTKTEFFRNLAELTGQNKKTIENIWQQMIDLVVRQLHVNGAVVLPGLAKLKIRKIPARKAGVYHILGKDMDLPFRPASKTVKALILKVFKNEL